MALAGRDAVLERWARRGPIQQLVEPARQLRVIELHWNAARRNVDRSRLQLEQRDLRLREPLSARLGVHGFTELVVLLTEGGAEECLRCHAAARSGSIAESHSE